MVTLDQGGCGRPLLRLISPPSVLGATVEHVFVQRHPTTSRGAQSWRILADDAPHLIGQSTPCGVRLVLVGARTTYADIDVSDRRLTAGVRLRPGALPALFGMPADALTDRSVALTDVLGRAPAEPYDALAADDAYAAVRSLIAFLSDRNRMGRPVDARIATLVTAATQQQPTTVRDAARVVDISERMVRYLSQEHVGMGMKRLWRIRRLHVALRLALQRPNVGWACAAVEAGYADQSHLVRDCRAFLGESPTAFAARAQR